MLDTTGLLNRARSESDDLTVDEPAEDKPFTNASEVIAELVR